MVNQYRLGLFTKKIIEYPFREVLGVIELTLQRSGSMGACDCLLTRLFYSSVG